MKEGREKRGLRQRSGMVHTRLLVEVSPRWESEFERVKENLNFLIAYFCIV